jgi:coproporphyrinogen III oxidase-like Fe-S oxidoreductase
MAEKMIMGLRLLKGVSKENFHKKFDINIKNIYDKEIKFSKRVFASLDLKEFLIFFITNILLVQDNHYLINC